MFLCTSGVNRFGHILPALPRTHFVYFVPCLKVLVRIRGQPFYISLTSTLRYLHIVSFHGSHPFYKLK